MHTYIYIIIIIIIIIINMQFCMQLNTDCK